MAASNPNRLLWSQDLLHRVIDQQKDPYADAADWSAIPEESVTRYDFDPRLNRWSKSEHRVKIQPEPFAKGSMRSCYRMKKLSVFINHATWENASAYVAKCYTKIPDSCNHRDMVETDIRIQMMAKLYADHFNQNQPPKKIDVMQVFMIEFHERPGRPCFCVERFLEGEYKKYNSNVGYADEHRNTPQAFSHFTFERSNGRHLVVDIQGVNDIYTDPVINAMDEEENFGEGNLGLSGYALFFHTHHCNAICRHLKLRPFEHYPYAITLSNLQIQEKLEINKDNKGEGIERLEIAVPDVKKTVWRREQFSKVSRMRHHWPSKVKFYELGYSPSSKQLVIKKTYGDVQKEDLESPSQIIITNLRFIIGQLPPGSSDLKKALEEELKNLRPLLKQATDLVATDGQSKRNSATTPPEDEFIPDEDRIEKIIGLVHRRIAIHFIANDLLFDIPASETDLRDIVLYHYKKAAEYHCILAQLALANFYEDKPCVELATITSKPTNGSLQSSPLVDKKIAFHYARLAGSLGSRIGAIKTAQIAEAMSPDETGYSGGLSGHVKHRIAVEWYERAVKASISAEDEQSGSFELGVEDHDIFHRIGELWLHGEFGVEKNLEKAAEAFDEAAEAAQNAMKARKALIYYQLAEETRAQMEDQESVVISD